MGRILHAIKAVKQIFSKNRYKISCCDSMGHYLDVGDTVCYRHPFEYDKVCVGKVTGFDGRTGVIIKNNVTKRSVRKKRSHVCYLRWVNLPEDVCLIRADGKVYDGE